MVAAKVQDAGGKLVSHARQIIRILISHPQLGPEGDTYKACLREVREMACATLFSPVSRQEAIQATSEYFRGLSFAN